MRSLMLILAFVVIPAPVLATHVVAPLPHAATAPQRLASELVAGRHPGITGFVFAAGRAPATRFEDRSLAKTPGDIRSATKSITALLVGIAIDQKLLPSVDAKAIDYLPELRDVLADDPRKSAISIADLLTMRSGLDCNDWDKGSPGHEDTMYRKRDWLRFWASRPMRAAPGETFSYCTGNVVALGRILARATGMPMDAYARKVLFTPLGIEDARWETWNAGNDIDSGGHLRLRPDDLLRIGRLVLHRGTFDERRVVSTEWIDRMTSAHTGIPGMPQRYGYLWYIDETTRPGLPRTRLWMAMGNGGNFIVVMPEIDAVAVFTGTRFNRKNAMEPLTWLRDRLLPEMLAKPYPNGKW